MSGEGSAPPGDRAVVSVLVKVPLREAFRIFTEEIDAWWRDGLKYRVGRNRSVVHLEPKLGGRLFESFERKSGPGVVETGLITCWEPPSRFVFQWRAANFAPSEKTEVEVLFEPSASGTLVTVCHRGWSQIRPDHPVRHGQEAQAFIRTMGMWWGDLMTSLREHAKS
ncbi:MAG TPA: SRPBCC domain-containing protein [Polyangiaceae bacterium]|nr:SRPBCC domain-containing protein [Polyangiaceae bacterium]